MSHAIITALELSVYPQVAALTVLVILKRRAIQRAARAHTEAADAYHRARAHRHTRNQNKALSTLRSAMVNRLKEENSCT